MYTWTKWGRKRKYGKSTTAGCRPVYTDVSLRKDRSTVALEVDDGTYRGRGDQVSVPSAGGDFDVVVTMFLLRCLTKDMAENAMVRSRHGCGVDACAVADGKKLGLTDIWKGARTWTFFGALVCDQTDEFAGERKVLVQVTDKHWLPVASEICSKPTAPATI